MKTLTFRAVIGLCLLFIPGFVVGQTEICGSWEGFFMNDFKTIIELKSKENTPLSGTIKMFNGQNIIQNDPITRVENEDGFLTFYIASKETSFKGEFRNNKSEIAGKFIFPDKSEHPIALKKRDTENQSNDATGKTAMVKFSAAELDADVNFLLENLKNNHPRLYAYTPEDVFNNSVDLARKSIKDEMDVVEFFSLIAPLVTAVKCSHTAIRLPADVQNSIEATSNYLPLKVLFEGNTAYCVDHFESGSEPVPGRKIISINDVPIQKIRDQLYLFIASEGNNVSTKNYQLNQKFNDYYNLIDNSPTYRVEYKTENGVQTSLLEACSYSTLNSSKEIVPNKQVSFVIDENTRTCYLTVPSFQIPDINKYIQEMDEIFSFIQKNNIQHLVLDLRGNSGGHPIFAAQLFSYLTGEKFTWFERNDAMKEFEPLYRTMQPDSLNFKGELFVLTDGGCLSTTGHLLAQIKAHTNAVFVGNDPGSSALCNDFSIQISLPNTGIEVNIPRTTFTTAVETENKAIPLKVDYTVKLTISDYLKRKDCCLSFVNQLITSP